MTVNDDGTGLYSTGLGHGDALMVSDMDPSRPGEEVYMPMESPGSNGHIDSNVHDAATGQVIFSTANLPNDPDVGRGNSFDIDPRFPGFENWNSNDASIFSIDGTAVQAKPSNMFTNFGIWWDADPMRELLDGTTISDWRITNGVGGRSNYDLDPATSGTQSAPNAASNNGTKSTPCLVADLFGDWREEVVWRRADNTALEIFTTTISATTRMPTLMDDVQYRESVAWQNVGYNQPTATSFYLGSIESTGTQFPPIPTPKVYLAGVAAPGAPSSLLASPISINEVDLNWGTVAGASSYIIRRSTTPGGPYTTIADGIAGTSFADTSTFGATNYYYVVSAFGPGGEGGNSNQATASTPSPVQTYQAESASLGGGTVSETANAGFNGAGYVNFPTTGGFLEFDNVYAGPVGGNMLIRFRYAQNTGTRTGNLIINGVSQPITFTSTGSFTTWSNLEVMVNLNPGINNTVRLESTGQDLGNVDQLQVNVVPDTTAPTAGSPQFQFESAPNQILVTFSEDVSAGLGPEDIVIQPVGGGSPISATGFTYLPGNIARFDLPTPLPDGNYSASFVPGSVVDLAGNPLAPGFSFPFYVLAADANRDRKVDETDLGILSLNWGQSGMTFSQGNFDYSADGIVNVDDLNILASHWQQSIALPVSSPSPVRTPKSRPTQRPIDLVMS
jgi:hypothetical protein